MSKNPRKSIVANFGLLSAELESDQTAEPSTPSVPSTPSGARVAAGVVGAAHRAIDDIRAERDRLKAIVEAGGGAVLELDASLIDPSPYPDRLSDDDDGDFEAFKRSILDNGQKVPVQVRRNPADHRRYQIVYGHRRWRAAKELGRPVRAIEVELSDLDLVVAQGIENANRQDLSWIERTLFASHMDAAGIKPRDIYAALAIEDAELARMRSVYRTIPSDVIDAIGRAPKVGRPRWVDFARTLAGDPTGLDKVRRVLSELRERPVVSDMRFQLAFDSIRAPSTTPKNVTELLDSDGAKLGEMKVSAKEIRVVAEGDRGLEFLRSVEKEIAAMTERFSLRTAD